MVVLALGQIIKEMSYPAIKNKYIRWCINIISIIIIFNIDNIYSLYIKKQDFEGVVVRKYIKIERGKIPYLSVKSKNKINNYNICNYIIYKIIDSGDYIIKKKDDLEYILIHKNDTIKFRH